MRVETPEIRTGAPSCHRSAPRRWSGASPRCRSQGVDRPAAHRVRFSGGSEAMAAPEIHFRAGFEPSATPEIHFRAGFEASATPEIHFRAADFSSARRQTRFATTQNRSSARERSFETLQNQSGPREIGCAEVSWASTGPSDGFATVSGRSGGRFRVGKCRPSGSGRPRSWGNSVIPFSALVASALPLDPVGRKLSTNLRARIVDFMGRGHGELRRLGGWGGHDRADRLARRIVDDAHPPPRSARRPLPGSSLRSSREGSPLRMR